MVEMFAEAEEFLKNPREFLPQKDAEMIEKHSSIGKANKRMRTQSPSGNQLLLSSLNYDLLNSAEKEFCEKINILPSDYLDLKTKIIREQGKWRIISVKLMTEKLSQVNTKSIHPSQVKDIFDFWLM